MRPAGTLAHTVVRAVAYGLVTLPEFFSARLGCRVEQPITGTADIAALCIRKT